MLIEGLDIEVVGLDGSPLRRLVLDPTTDYQRLPGRECPGLQCLDTPPSDVARHHMEPAVGIEPTT
jgi:hypothetical protein